MDTQLLRERLANIEAHLVGGWDIPDIVAPTMETIQQAKTCLDILDLLPLEAAGIIPAGDGGIVICFVKQAKRAEVDFENDGGVVAAIYGIAIDDESGVWEVDDLRLTLQRIKDWLDRCPNLTTLRVFPNYGRVFYVHCGTIAVMRDCSEDR